MAYATLGSRIAHSPEFGTQAVLDALETPARSLTPTELKYALHGSTGQVERSLRQAVEAGLVERHRGTGDGRQTLYVSRLFTAERTAATLATTLGTTAGDGP